MTYTKQTWQNMPARTTPLSASRLNHMEDGIQAADAAAAAAAGGAATALTAHNDDTTNVHGIADTADLVLTDDPRLTDARTPTSHASTHATAGSDPITPASIGAIPAAEKSAPSGVATLDGSGKIPTTQLPALAITTNWVVASQAAMLALDAQEGDVAIRTDVSRSFILGTGPASTLGSWHELLTPTDAVLSVDGRTGTVTLSDLYAALVHGHAQSDITGLATALAGKASTTHASTHATGGSDPITPASIGAAAATDLALRQPDGPWKSGCYYTARPMTIASQASVLNLLTLLPVWVPTACTLDRIAVAVKGSATGSALRLGLYANNASTDQPTTLYVDGGTVAATSNGAKEVVISQAVPAGWLWIAVAAQGGTPTIEAVTCSLPPLDGGGPEFAQCGWYTTGVSGALPSTLSTIFRTGGVIRASVRVA